MGLDLWHVVPTPNETSLYFSLDELSENNEFVARYKDWFKTIENEDELSGSEIVLYFNEKAYQRKGMVTKFFDAFDNCLPYFEKRLVEKASFYLDPNSPWGSDFKENFLDNFVEGESVFFASW